MNEVIRAAAELQDFCAARNWRFCFIGGLAVLRWGEPRETADADLTLLTGFGTEDPFIDALLGRFDAPELSPLAELKEPPEIMKELDELKARLDP